MKQRVWSAVTSFRAFAALCFIAAWFLIVPLSAQVRVIQSLTRNSFTAVSHFILGTADTSGIRLEVNSGIFDVREGDDSALAPFRASAVTVGDEAITDGGTELSFSGSTFTTANAYVGATGFFEINGRARLSSSVASSLIINNSAATNPFTVTLADWGTTLSAESVSWANDEVKAGPTSGVGFLRISIGTDNRVCEFELTGTSAPVEIRDGGTLCSITATTASSINVYYSSGYQIENKRGGTRALRVTFIGG